MSTTLTKKQMAKFQTLDPDIESLQYRLLQSLSSAFDPTAAVRSDDFFLAQDYSLGNVSDNTDPFKSQMNPYQELAQKARSHVEKSQADRALRPKTQVVTGNKNNGTFVTFLDVEGNLRKNKETPKNSEFDILDYKDPLPPVSFDNMLLNVTSTTREMDDLEELRKMIRKTKKDMNSYGKELMGLKNVISGINDYAVKELGYGVNHDVFHNMENAISGLKDQNEYKYMKNTVPAKGSSKAASISIENKSNTTKTVVKKGGSGTSSFIISKRSVGAGLRATSFKASLKR